LAEILNQKLSPRCFAHRRAHGEKAKKGSTAVIQLLRSLWCIAAISYSQISKIPQETQRPAFSHK